MDAMMRVGLVAAWAASVLIVGCAPAVHPELTGKGGKPVETLLIDDFTGDDARSALGTHWETITDQVMGGVSTGRHRIHEVAGRRALHLTGQVSLENNGGFIQARLPLARGGHHFDASAFRGIRLWVRGNAESYSLHLRTPRTWLPWQYFHADFDAPAAWTQVELPFADFDGAGFKLDASLDPGHLRSLAVVAIERRFTADLAVSRIEFYR
ncbi:MAG: CIA30 family protein [Planctomycetota bacterium]